jgi:hypothetical protein
MQKSFHGRWNGLGKAAAMGPFCTLTQRSVRADEARRLERPSTKNLRPAAISTQDLRLSNRRTHPPAQTSLDPLGTPDLGQ